MPEDPKEGADKGQPLDDPSREVTLKAGGKTLTLTAAKRDTWAQQGANMEAKERALRADRASLEVDTEGYAAYKNMQAQVKANPVLAEGMQILFNDPQAVIDAQNQGPGDHGDGDDDFDQQRPTPRRKSSGDRELEQLRQKVTALETRDSERTVRETVAGQDTRIDSEISEYPWLKPGTESHDFAKDQIAALMVQEPQNGLAATVAHVATRMRRMMEEEATERVRTAESNKVFRTERPNRGTPTFKPKEPLTKKSFDDGSMAKNLKQALASWVGRD